MHSKTTKYIKTYGALFIVITVAFLLRIHSYAMEPVISRDSVYYLFLSQGKQVEEYPVKFGKQPPMLLSILRFFDRIDIDPYLGAVSLNIVCGLILCVIVWLSCRQLGFSGIWCVFCALMIAIQPELVKNSKELQRETLYITSCSIAVFYGIKNYTTKKIFERLLCSFLIGVFGATAALFRFEGWELLPIALVWSIWVLFHRKDFLSFVTNNALTLSGWSMALCALLLLCNYPISLYMQNMLNYF